MPEYTSRPKPRRARIAWDYFVAQHPWMKTTERTLTLGYSPNLDYYAPGWYMLASHTEADTLHWHGGNELSYKVFCATLQNWNRNL